MVNAAETKKRAQAAIAKRDESAKQAEIDRRNLAAIRLKKAREYDLPRYWNELLKKIDDAADSGYHSVDYYIPWTNEPELAQEMCERLRSGGYRAVYSVSHSEGSMDAPSYDSTNITVSW